MLRLGGPEPHGRRSGVVHVVAETDARRPRRRPAASPRCSVRQGACARGRRRRPRAACCPSRPAAPTTCTRWSSGVLDEGTGLELHPAGRPTSRPRSAASAVAPSASSPTTRCGSAAAWTRRRREKAARFVRMCDAFGVPLVVLVDVPGLPARRRPGVGRRRTPRRQAAARLRRGVVPRVTVITRKAYGGAYIAMDSRALGATRSSPGRVRRSPSWVRSPPCAMLHRRRLAEISPELRARARDRAGGGARAARRRPRQGDGPRLRRRDRDPAAHAQRRGPRDRELTRRPRAARQHPTLTRAQVGVPLPRARCRQPLGPAAVRRC